MKYVMATMVLALAACGGERNRPPPNHGGSEPVSTTTTTSAALTIQQPVTVETHGEAPIVAAKETDRQLATSIRSHLGHDESISSVPWQRVSMEVEDQHVTLRGSLPTLADSSELEQAVRHVKGVRAVKNEIRTNDAYGQ